MKKLLFLLSAAVVAGLAVVACQKDNTLVETQQTIPVVADASDRADCSVNWSVDGAQFGSGDYARLTYYNASNVLSTATLNSGTTFLSITVKAGTTIDVKHRLTCNSSGPGNYIRTTLSSGGVSKYYKYHSDGSGSVKSWVCQQTNCTLPDYGTCPCCDVTHTDTTNPDYWCN